MSILKNSLLWIFLAAILLLQSCDDDGAIFSSRPKGVLSKKEMIAIMVDIHLQESNIRFGNPQLVNQDLRNYTRKEYLKVFANHNVKPEDFSKSLDYYLLKVNDLDDIYTGVINRLSEMQSEMQSKLNKAESNSGTGDQGEKKPGEGNDIKTPSGK